jgi:hypothetical protein
MPNRRIGVFLREAVVIARFEQLHRKVSGAQSMADARKLPATDASVLTRSRWPYLRIFLPADASVFGAIRDVTPCIDPDRPRRRALVQAAAVVRRARVE